MDFLRSFLVYFKMCILQFIETNSNSVQIFILNTLPKAFLIYK